ncbi:hypothetical protein [Pseudoalteromonas galatheae]|uniref:hypothetical protein n=1 Tax=Pseudoalteromonas galatheae TaxID=579562 RepID=UPI0030D4E620
MQIHSIDRRSNVELELSFFGYADDEEWVKEVGVHSKIKSTHSSSNLAFKAYSSSHDDEIAQFINALSSLYDARSGEAQLLLRGAAEDTYDDRELRLRFYSLSSLGHLALEVTHSGSERYSNTEMLDFKTKITFEIEAELLQALRLWLTGKHAACLHA